MTDAAGRPSGAALHPRVAETHTGLVVLAGDRAYKVKKPVVTDFLDFSRVESRERACAREVVLNRRLAPESYLGVGHFGHPDPAHLDGPEVPEPVIVMRRHPDERRLATMVRRGQDVTAHLDAIIGMLSRFHADAERGPDIDAQARIDAVAQRWQENLDELAGYASDRLGGLDPEVPAAIGTMVRDFLSGRAVLFATRIAERRIVDGHADLLADDIFCLEGAPQMLDCLEFDDRLRYVDVVDDVAFLAMDLEFLGRADLAEFLIGRYLQLTADDAPASLVHFYIAYRAVVRAKVDCVRVRQGDRAAADDARRHLAIAAEHLCRGAVRLVVVGGGPGTGKTTLAHALAAPLGAVVVSTDDVRAEMVSRGEISGEAGTLGEGLYSRENIDAVYTAVLRRAHLGLCRGRTVILDGTWHDEGHRTRAAEVAAEASAPIIELLCAAPLDASVARIRARATMAGPTGTTSQVTPEIAGALADRTVGEWPGAHRIDTTADRRESVAEALDICLTTP